jgi:hypothetical protein
LPRQCVYAAHAINSMRISHRICVSPCVTVAVSVNKT